jgi:hypothetical protein
LGFLQCRIIPGKVPALPFKYPPNTRQIPGFFFVGPRPYNLMKVFSYRGKKLFSFFI